MRIIIAGYGNVGREFGLLLAEKLDVLHSRYALSPTIVGVTTGRHGGWIVSDPAGISPAIVAAADWPRSDQLPEGAQAFSGDALALLDAIEADLLIELSPTNPATGEPALGYVRAALDRGLDVVTANKGPIALAYGELRTTADRLGRHLRFESTVIDGTPVINLAEFNLPATEILGIRAIINATSNFILAGLVLGQSFEETLARAQQIGIAEADPSLDLDGWDAAVKLTILANVLMDAELTPAQVVRESSAERMREMARTLSPGQVAKQVATLERDTTAPGGVRARVALTVLQADDSLAGIGQGKAAIQFQTDTLGDLTVIEGPGTPRQTAFGVLADLITIGRARVQEETR